MNAVSRLFHMRVHPQQRRSAESVDNAILPTIAVREIRTSSRKKDSLAGTLKPRTPSWRHRCSAYLVEELDRL